MEIRVRKLPLALTTLMCEIKKTKPFPTFSKVDGACGKLADKIWVRVTLTPYCPSARCPCAERSLLMVGTYPNGKSLQ